MAYPPVLWSVGSIDTVLLPSSTETYTVCIIGQGSVRKSADRTTAQLSEGEGGLVGAHPVAKEANAVHPIGSPMSASTNSGLRTTGPCPSSPAVGVVGTWWERTAFGSDDCRVSP